MGQPTPAQTSAPESSGPEPLALPAQVRQAVQAARATNAEGWRDRKSPPILMRGLCRDIDRCVRALWEAHPVPQAALLAIGGYGRGELSPFSDIDLLILLPESVSATAIETPLSQFVSSLWDAGLDAGHSVRSLSECMGLAQNDLTIATSLLEARVLVGDSALVAELQSRWHQTIDQSGF
ncbi:MAG: nucleotidyltransferase domain-containing protein, partial [Burkholderiaceae bacterium]